MQEFRPPIDPFDGTATVDMVTFCWPGFRRLKRQRKLPEVIDYLTTAERRAQPIEIKVLLASVAFESLKTTFATCAGIDFHHGRFRERNPNGKWQNLSFEVLVNRMLKSQRMPPIRRNIVSLRNEIIHRGVSEKPVERLADLYAEMMSVATKYLLRVTGFRGSVHDYATQQQVIL